MNETDLHIVTLNVPYPPDYGGMIDTYYRIKSLKDIGVRIHLHCFEYGRNHSKGLESLCKTINYYPRQSGLLNQFSSVPYIVFSRRSERLIKNLIKDQYPILFDGLHSTYYINHPALSRRRKFVRLHNIEHEYYNALADNELNLFKRTYFRIESIKLKQYEKVIEKADYVFPLSDVDQKYFGSKYNHSVFLAPFHPFHEPVSVPGVGDYIIYHGDLSVNENVAVANHLISNVFSRIPYKCIIAGKDPPEFLISKALRFGNVRVIANPDSDKMTRLIINGQINLLPALASNGYKLKILMALYAGRHCIVNSTVAENTSITRLCHVANSDKETVNKVNLLMKEPFTQAMIVERRQVLSKDFDNLKNAKKLAELIFLPVDYAD